MKILLSAAVLALGVVLPSQAYQTAPDGYLTKDGEYYYCCSLMLRVTAGNHTQKGDSSFKKGSAAVLRELAFRSDKGRAYNGGSIGAGVTWTSCSLSLGHTDISKWSSKFSLNPIGATTNVFSGTFKQPAVTGTGKGVWGDSGNVVFSKAFIYDGKNDILQDWNMAQGNLTNGYTGTSAFPSAPYLDAARGGITAGWSFLSQNPNQGGAYLPRVPNSSTTRCADSNWGTSRDAYTYMFASIYNDNYPTTSLRCMYRAGAYSYYGAPNKPQIGAMTVGGSDAGVPIGAKCNRLHVNMGFAVVVTTGTANASGFMYIFGSPTVYAKYNNLVAGVKVYAQAAWDDTSSGQLGLTIASRLDLIKKGAAVGNPSERYTYRYRTTRGGSSFAPNTTDASYGFVTSNSSFYGNVIDRYRVK